MTCAQTVLLINRKHQNEVMTFPALRGYRPEGGSGELVTADCFAEQESWAALCRAAHVCEAQT